METGVYRRREFTRWRRKQLIFDVEPGDSATDPLVPSQSALVFSEALWPIDWRAELFPDVFAPPEITPLLPENLHDGDDCQLRRGEMDHACLRRGETEILALRRAPECPDEFACPNTGCT